MAILQAAAIPIRGGQACVVNSSSGKRWVIPKGHIEAGHDARVTALKEAWEEAGLIGRLGQQPVGAYRYEKNDTIHHVTVYLMHVAKVSDVWPEDHRRQRRWVPLDNLDQVISQVPLQEIIKDTLAERASIMSN